MFAYGQTGSGKTHTVSGMINLITDDLFDKSITNISLHVSFIQLLGNSVSDLMTDDNTTSLSIMEDKFGKICMAGATEKTITDKDQFLNITREALERRSTSTTLKNDTSSRSHAVCRIRFENTEVKAAEDGFLYLIDLAGSENASDTQFHDKTRIQETKDINKSLMCLKDCIRNRSKAAVDPTTFVHIPYRQSKLSLLLKDAFELESFKQSKTVVIANIAPSAADMAMTLNTLRWEETFFVYNIIFEFVGM